MTKPGSDDDAGRRSLSRRRGNRGRDRWRRHCNDNNVGHFGQRIVGSDGGYAFNLVVPRIDKVDRAGEAAAAQVFEHGPARRSLAGDAPTTATDRGANSLSRR